MSGRFIGRCFGVMAAALACAGCPSGGGGTYRDDTGGAISPQAAEWYNRGVQATKAGRMESAIDYYGRAIAIDPHGVMYYNRGIVQHTLRRHREAIADFTHAIEIEPQIGDAYLQRARSRAAMLAGEAAMADLKASEARPIIRITQERAAEIAAEVRRMSAISQRVDQIVADVVNAPMAAHLASLGWTNLTGMEKALSDLKRNDSAAAIEALTATTKALPDHAAAFFLRGLLYQETRKPELAVPDFTRAIELEPQIASSYLYRGHSQRTMGNLDAAIVDYTRVIALTPGSADAYLARGRTYANLRRFEQAAADCTRAIELAPESSDAFHVRGVCMNELRRYDPAHRDLQKAMELMPDNPRFLNEVAWFRATCPDVRHRDPAAALSLARKAVELEADNWDYLDTLACVHAANGDFKTAIEVERRAVGLCPEAEHRKRLERRIAGFREGKNYLEQQAAED